MALAWKVDENSKVKLKDYAPAYTGKHTDHTSAEVDTMRQYKDEWRAELEARGQRELEQLKQMQKQ